MLAIVAAEMNLMPDWTIVVQLGIFLCTLAILTVFIFKPVLRILDRRKSFTEGAYSEAQMLGEEAARLDAERSRAVAMALSEAKSEADRHVADTHRQAEGQLAEARVKAKQLLDTAEVSVESSEESVVAEMRRRADELAQEIVSRVTRS
jgi:F-type H+-transporting ATPase subunit b